MPPPVRIKLYGLISITKRGYLLCVFVAVVGLAVFLFAWFLTASEIPVGEPPDTSPTPTMLWRQWTPWIIGAGVVLAGIEAFFVLRRFHQAEAEQRARAEQLSLSKET